MCFGALAYILNCIQILFTKQRNLKGHYNENQLFIIVTKLCFFADNYSHLPYNPFIFQNSSR